MTFSSLRQSLRRTNSNDGEGGEEEGEEEDREEEDREMGAGGGG